MLYIHHHIKAIIESYNGGVPFTHFLRNYFKLHPKLGSRDRKILSDMAYCWYRCSKGFADDIPFENKLNACLFLCDTSTVHSLRFLPENWQAAKNNDLGEKLELLKSDGLVFDIERIASFQFTLSEGIDRKDWLQSMLSQPKLFLRIRKDHSKIEDVLRKNDIVFEKEGNCLALANSTPIDKLLPADSYVVQDRSSQHTGKYFQPEDKETWWDCCSGAGGKSLLLKDLNKNIRLTVSDKRASILHNLRERFKQNHHQLPVEYVLDVSDAHAAEQALGKTLFDNIICDVPCTGSGTWARTPEQLYYFEEKLVGEIAVLQSRIALNASRHLKQGGRLLYITCSVFEAENEQVVDVLTRSGLVVENAELINGIKGKADSMFIAVLRKP